MSAAKNPSALISSPLSLIISIFESSGKLLIAQLKGKRISPNKSNRTLPFTTGVFRGYIVLARLQPFIAYFFDPLCINHLSILYYIRLTLVADVAVDQIFCRNVLCFS
jgi:hypothetical protein